MARLQKSLEIVIHFKRFFLKSRVLATFWEKGGRVKNTIFGQIRNVRKWGSVIPISPRDKRGIIGTSLVEKKIFNRRKTIISTRKFWHCLFVLMVTIQL